MSSVAKGVGSIVSGVVKGIGSVVKAVTKSPLGKIALMAATVYAGGWALGAWGAPAAAEGAALAAPTAEAATAAGVGSSVADTAAANAFGTGLGATETAGASTVAPSVAESFAANAPGSSIGSTAGGAAGDTIGGAVANTAANQAAGGSTLGSMMGGPDMGVGLSGSDMGELAAYKAGQGAADSGGILNKVLDFYKGDFAKAALMNQAGGAIKGLFTPNPVDERLRLENEQRARQQQTMNLGQYPVVTPTQTPLRRPDGTPVFQNSILNTNLRGA